METAQISIGKRIKKLKYNHIMEYSAAVEKTDVNPYILTKKERYQLFNFIEWFCARIYVCDVLSSLK